MVKFCSAQYIIICNSLTKCPNSRRMTCIDGLSSSVVDYVISDIPLYKRVIDFNIFNDHEPEYDHRPLIITLNISMHSKPKEGNCHCQNT